jgi:large-conductance mechanosensitive channel
MYDCSTFKSFIMKDVGIQIALGLVVGLAMTVLLVAAIIY